MDGCKYLPEAIRCTDWMYSDSFCLKCGWNPEVAAKRKEEIYKKAKKKPKITIKMS